MEAYETLKRLIAEFDWEHAEPEHAIAYRFDIVLRGLSPSSKPQEISFAAWTFAGVVQDLDELGNYLADRLGWPVSDDRRAQMVAHLALQAKREAAGFRLEISRTSAVLVWGKS